MKWTEHMSEKGHLCEKRIIKPKLLQQAILHYDQLINTRIRIVLARPINAFITYLVL